MHLILLYYMSDLDVDDVAPSETEFKKILKYIRNYYLSRYTSLMIVSEIKYETVLLTINYYFVISESEKIKNKRISVQLSDIAESIIRNIITDK